MINDLNRVLLMGYLGADAQAPQSDNTPVTFSVATTDRWVDEKKQKQTRTEWHNIVVFGNLRKYAAKLKKGDRFTSTASYVPASMTRRLEARRSRSTTTRLPSSRLSE